MLNTRYKTNGSRHLTMERFFATAFLRTASMLAFALVTGSLGRIMAYRVITSMGNYPFFPILIIMFITMGIDFVIKRNLQVGNESKISFLCHTNVGILGFMSGIITSAYRLQLIGSALVTTAVIFIMSATYGYVTNKDMSKLAPVISCLGISCMVLAAIGFIGSFFSRQFASYIFSIESVIGIIFNLLFIVFFINKTKQLFIQNSNSRMLSLFNIYASYIMFHNILSLFLNIIYLLGRRENDR